LISRRWAVPGLAALVCFLVLTLVDGLPVVVGWDESSSIWLQGPSHAWMTVIGSVIDVAFSAQVVAVLSAILLAVLWFTGRRRAAIVFAFMFPAVVVEALMKYVLRHPNPEFILETRKVGFHARPLGIDFLLSSFPSGHAARSGFFIGWLAIIMASRVQMVPAAFAGGAIAAFIGWSRVYAGDHWGLDIIGGELLAVFFLCTGVIAAALLPKLPRLSRLFSPPVTAR
jgi:membrane-associated phospholipid phosphatase